MRPSVDGVVSTGAFHIRVKAPGAIFRIPAGLLLPPVLTVAAFPER